MNLRSHTIVWSERSPWWYESVQSPSVSSSRYDDDIYVWWWFYCLQCFHLTFISALFLWIVQTFILLCKTTIKLSLWKQFYCRTNASKKVRIARVLAPKCAELRSVLEWINKKIAVVIISFISNQGKDVQLRKWVELIREIEQKWKGIEHEYLLFYYNGAFVSVAS